MAHLSSLHLFALKSCAPMRVASAIVEPRGLQHDRRWLLIDADGRFVTGREEARLTRVQATPSAHGIRFDAPAAAPLDIPTPAADGPRIDVTIWKSQLSAVHAGPVADQWFSDVLQRPLRLVYMDAQARRPISSTRAHAGDETSFADAFPLLLLSAAALDSLNARLVTPVSMDRFRPNLVIADVPAHAEDDWLRVRIGAVEFDVVKPCGRCVFTTVDPSRGERDPSGEPLRTLIGYRRGDEGVTFGQYLTPRGYGVLREGDRLDVLASR